MPRRAPRPCAAYPCPNLVYEGSRCEKHRLPRPRDTRPSPGQRKYGHAWKKRRDAYLEEHPWCVGVNGRHAGQQVKAVIVDHIKPLRQGGRDDDTNYQSVCRSCHNYKTAHDGSKG